MINDHKLRYDRAMEAAFEANAAFDSFTDADERYKATKVVSKLPKVIALRHASDVLHSEFCDAQRESRESKYVFERQSHIVGSLIGPNVFEDMKILNKEQLERSIILKEKMAMMFFLSEDDFSAVRTSNNDGSVFAVVYTGDEKIDLALHMDGEIDDWTYDPDHPVESIVNNDEAFIIDVDGEQIDTRLGMTKELYSGLIDTLKVPPDHYLAQPTFLSGDYDPSRFATPTFGEVNAAGNVCTLIDRGRVILDFAFRPTAAI